MAAIAVVVVVAGLVMAAPSIFGRGSDPAAASRIVVGGTSGRDIRDGWTAATLPLTPIPTPSPSPTPALPQPIRYKIKTLDTIYTIAAKFNLRMSSVMWSNGLTNALIHVGQWLTLPPSDGLMTTVKDGETLDDVAARVHVVPDVIATANGLADGVALVADQVLFIPNGRGPKIDLTHLPPGLSYSSPLRGFSWPLANYEISQGYGCTGFWAEGPFGNCSHYHGGIDLVAPVGTPVLAAGAGKVTMAGWDNGGGGWMVCINHGDKIATCYGHMSEVAVRVGAQVQRGKMVGRLGGTGNATGAHLHFEIWKGPRWAGGVRLNPFVYLP
jgi:murein DD-endopeptidase MepM/ murein hydrolase activator NlpD